MQLFIVMLLAIHLQASHGYGKTLGKLSLEMNCLFLQLLIAVTLVITNAMHQMALVIILPQCAVWTCCVSKISTWIKHVLNDYCG